MQDDIHSLLERLETRLAFQEDTIEMLSQALIQQQRQLDALHEKMSAIQSKLKEVQGSPVASQAEETPPPHY